MSGWQTREFGFLNCRYEKDFLIVKLRLCHVYYEAL